MGRPKKRRGKIRITKSARLVHKNDATRVANGGGDTIPKAPFVMNDNGLNMRIKIKRKSR